MNIINWNGKEVRSYNSYEEFKNREILKDIVFVDASIKKEDKIKVRKMTAKDFRRITKEEFKSFKR